MSFVPRHPERTVVSCPVAVLHHGCGRWVKCCGVFAEKVEVFGAVKAFGAVVVRTLNVGYCGDF